MIKLSKRKRDADSQPFLRIRTLVKITVHFRGEKQSQFISFEKFSDNYVSTAWSQVGEWIEVRESGYKKHWFAVDEVLFMSMEAKVIEEKQVRKKD